MKEQIALLLQNAGFATRLYPNAVFVYLSNRHITKMEVQAALGEEFYGYSMRTSYDAHHFLQRGVLIWVGAGLQDGK